MWAPPQCGSDPGGDVAYRAERLHARVRARGCARLRGAGVSAVRQEGASTDRKLRIVLIYRSRVRGGFSIENLFSSLVPEMSRQVEVIEYHLTSKWGSLRDVLALRRFRADVYHITGDVHYLVLALPWRKTVVTVTDVYHMTLGLRGLKQLVFKLLWFDLPLPLAKSITAISAETKRQLEQHCRPMREEILVVHCGVAPRYLPSPKEFDPSRPRILFVGTAPGKNLRRLVSALEGIPCTLVAVGSVSPDLRVEIERLGIAFENHVDISDDALVALYQQCDIVAFPSLREGFGLPIVEAQAVGRALVTSDLSPMRDVAGPGACLVDPLDVAGIRRAVLRLIEDADYREGTIRSGLDNVRRFSAATIASEYVELYRDVAYGDVGRE